MKLILNILILCLSVCECHAEDANTKGPSDTTSTPKVADFQFDGIWKPKAAMLQGVLLPKPAVDAITLKIAHDKYEVTITGEEQPDKGMFILDETVTPMRMVIKSVSGPNKGKIILAIYEIKGENAMRVCYNLSGNAFPTEFKAPKNSEFYLVGYRRQKAEEPEKEQTP
ncbi:MAG TPA: TIGR03067 domain-containing protein [Planctomycetaceae bacterium]|nr:TIGR03067 domain-containing protein [Planctomycetaceae bacterium]|tara:strand:- start:144 stop:650 length:507 start_codon:yes stop_codon:yes gene_type:complete